MQEITGYLYTNWVECQLDEDPYIKTRNRIVYARPIKLYKNIDNTLKFVFKNQDQKRININHLTMSLSIFSSNSYTANQIVADRLTANSVNDDGSTLNTLDDGSSLFEDNAPAGYGALLEVDLEILDDGSTSATKGVAKAVIQSGTLDDLPGDSYYYSVKAIDTTILEGSDDVVVYSDDNFGVRGTVEILSGHYTAKTSVAINNAAIYMESEDLGTI